MTENHISTETGPTETGFKNSLIIQLLEEASFLYEQRLGLFDDPDVSWFEIKAFNEDRYEPFIDALVLGNELSLAICIKKAIEGDFGELHTAIRVFCRQGRQDLIEEVLDGLDFGDEERVKAVSDALCYELPELWQDEFLNQLLEKKHDCSLIAVSIIAFKRLDYSKKLNSILLNEETPKTLIIAILYALGRIRPDFRTITLLELINKDDKEIVDSAINALIRTGDSAALSSITSRIKPEDFPKISIGLCRNQDSLNDITLKLNSEGKEKQVHKDNILAAGLLGSISAITDLIDSLSNEDLSENASWALNLITGAELFEDHFIAEEIDEDMLFEDELEKFKKGELYAPGEEPGETITRLSQNILDWQAWWDKHSSEFNPAIRYRNGKPYSPECLIENLKSEKSPNIIRQFANEELVIRYGIDFPFETDMPVQDQISAIEHYEGWLKSNPDKFEDGKWYFNGSLI